MLHFPNERCRLMKGGRQITTKLRAEGQPLLIEIVMHLLRVIFYYWQLAVR